MIKELVQFTEIALADPVFRNLGVLPREGLHIVLQVEKTEEETTIHEKPLFAGFYSKKMKEVNEWLAKCAAWSQVSWMVDTNKCFDPTVKAIHSCSPFCFALKRTNLDGGEQFIENQRLNKSQVHERINSYFTKAMGLLKDADEKTTAEAFRIALNDRNQINRWLDECEDFKKVKDGEYVIFYLDLPVEKYETAIQKYRKEKLFNTPDYNFPKENPEHGTSNWFNGFPAKKPFLQHQSATFDIAGRITTDEARLLDSFSELSRRKVFPNPLPLFVYENERVDAFKIFKDDAASGDEKRKTYLEIIRDLWKDRNQELGNYYLLFLMAGEIRDFDFVSRFEFNLNSDGSPWLVKDLFNTGQEMRLENVSDLMTLVLPPMFNNALVVRRKEKDWFFHWFDEMDSKFCKTHNAYILAMKYRKAFYDFIYKSQRQSVNGRAIEEILLTGILDDIQMDEYKKPPGFVRFINTEERNICTKLNLLFSLHQYFSKPINPVFMPSKIEELSQRVRDVAAGTAHLENDEHFAFAAGQVLARIFLQNESANRTYKMLDPYFRFSEVGKFRESLQEFFLRYSHKGYSGRFEKVSSEVFSFELKGGLKSLRPLILAGLFYREFLPEGKKTLLHAEKEKPEAESAEIPADN